VFDSNDAIGPLVLIEPISVSGERIWLASFDVLHSINDMERADLQNGSSEASRGHHDEAISGERGLTNGAPGLRMLG
jgi:hypothetical protein